MSDGGASNLYRELAHRMTPVCAEAVDDMEVAAVLEADGITDALARTRYGVVDVFHLAEQLRREIPRRPTPTEVVAGPWRATILKHALRGGLFGLPALCYLAVAGIADGRRAGGLMVTSVLLSWAVSQGLAYVGHVRLGWGDAPGAKRVLLGGLVVGVPGILTVIGIAALALGVPPGVFLIAAAQVIYLLAATVALVLGAEWLLLAALAPGVLAAAVGLLIGDDAVRSWPVVACALGTVLGCVAVAWQTTRGARPGLPTGAELWQSLPSAAFGVSVGGLLLFVPAARTLPPSDTIVLSDSGAAAGLAALVPLSVSMGVAEWLLVDYRARTHRALQRATTLRSFGRRAGGALLGATGMYLGALVAGCAVAYAVVMAVTDTAPALPALAGYVALGGALFLALVLMSFRVRACAVAGCAVAVVAEIGLLIAYRDPDPVQLGVTAALFLGLCAYAWRALGRAARHL